MTVAAVEAAPAVEASAADATAGRAAAARPATRKPRARRPVQRQAAGTDRRQRAAQGQRRRKGESFTPSELGQEARRRAPTTAYAGKNYQPAILAEFVAAILLVAVTPFASSKNPEGLSPYQGTDMVKLVALTVVYFILALISSASRGAGKAAALFGLLVLLGVGLNEAANLVSAFDLLAGIPLPGTAAAKTGREGGGVKP